MKEIKRIVVPVDFSKITAKLIDYSTYMAEKLSATIHFIHAVTYMTGDAMIGAPFAVEYEAKMLADAQTKMANLLEDNREKAPGCTGEVVVGDPVDTIVDTAKGKEADLIIIGTHGTKGLEKILLGSVTERVLKRAPCPVLTMNPYKIT
ncbi:universal stress protein [Desulfocastanea catecholica]